MKKWLQAAGTNEQEAIARSRATIMMPHASEMRFDEDKSTPSFAWIRRS